MMQAIVALFNSSTSLIAGLLVLLFVVIPITSVFIIALALLKGADGGVLKPRHR